MLSTFTPLVFSVNREMAKECLKFQNCVAEKITNKSGCLYQKFLSIIKCKLLFVILRRSFTTHSGNHAVVDSEIAFDYTRLRFTDLRFERESLFWEFNQDFRACSSKHSVFFMHLFQSQPHCTYSRHPFSYTLLHWFQTVPRKTFPRRTHPRSDIPDGHFLEQTHPQETLPRPDKFFLFLIRL